MPRSTADSTTSTVDEPDVNSRRILDAGAIAVSWLAALICVHVMYVGFVLYGSKPKSAAVLAMLTENGRQYYNPERELPIYVLGCTFALLLAVVIGVWRRRSLAPRMKYEIKVVYRTCMFSVLSLALCSGANIAWILLLRAIGASLHVPRAELACVLLAPALFEAGLVADSQRSKPSTLMRRFLGYIESEISAFVNRDQPTIYTQTSSAPTPDRVSRLAAFSWTDIGVVALIIALVYVPRTDLLAGYDFHLQSFHHWDYFAIGPAIGLLKGKALASQVYSQYGLGWPLLLSRLDPVVRLGYGHTYKIAVLFGSLYYAGLYLLLRRLLPGRNWAIGGVLLAMCLQMFNGLGTDAPIWCVPSASVLRTPCDVWVLVLLLEHWRTRKPALMLLAGAMVGLSLLFVIDTGVYLAITFMAYNLIWLMSCRTTAAGAARCPDLTKPLLILCASVLVGAIVLMIGMYASSGTAMFAPGYVRSWLEVLWIYPEGVSMLPMIESETGVIASYWLVLLCVGTVICVALRFKRYNQDGREILTGCIAILALFYHIYYIGRSHPSNINHLCVPFCIVLLSLIEYLTTGLRFALPVIVTESRRRIVSAAGLGFVCAALVLSPQLQTYPNVFWWLWHRSPQSIECYFPGIHDVCVPSTQVTKVQPFLAAVAEMRQYSLAGESIAVIADDDTSLYVASRAKLWNRYTPLLPALMTKRMLGNVDKELGARTADYVFLIKKDPAEFKSHPTVWRMAHTSDSWAQLAATTRALYQFDHICGAYEVWRR